MFHELLPNYFYGFFFNSTEVHFYVWKYTCTTNLIWSIHKNIIENISVKVLLFNVNYSFSLNLYFYHSFMEQFGFEGKWFPVLLTCLCCCPEVCPGMKSRPLCIDFQKSNSLLPSAEFSAALLPDAAWRCCALEVKNYQENQRIKMWTFFSINSEMPLLRLFSHWELGRMGLRKCFACWVLNWPSGQWQLGLAEEK